ncbi:MAG: hypothetical protein PF447_12000 [Spirochaetaceae bacterium]|jgi:hypothetical protein|nr:hypothetical protein [Spirochaetaceae bacterium]
MRLKFPLIFLVILLFLSCVPGDGTNNSQNEAGFFWGIWHGWIAPVSLIISFFNPQRSIYETHNIGFIYDLGFYLAILGGFGGFRLFRKSKDRQKDQEQ